ncbi:MAG: hypothetical protein J3R72DRAFT_457947 [Linnemannia gamsii]|nr:MAG: hypothetical protein J3R72DRAFT_457947 [Linnemannia gamsii]
MMRMMPSLQHLDLEVIAVLPSPSSSSSSSLSRSMAENDSWSRPRSSSSLVLSQSLWNVHSSSPSPPSSFSASSPTLGTRGRGGLYRQGSVTSSRGSSGRCSSSDDDDVREEKLDFVIVDESGARGPIENDGSLPMLPALSLSTGSFGETFSSLKATIRGPGAAGFPAGESDDDDLSLRPPLVSSTLSRSKTQFHSSSHTAPLTCSSTGRQKKEHRFDPRSGPRLPRQHHQQQEQHPSHAHSRNQPSDGRKTVPVVNNCGYDNHQQHQQQQEVLMTPPALSFVFQFPSVRSLTFRGPRILPELLEFLPNLDSLALQPSPSSSPPVPVHVKSRNSSSPSWAMRSPHTSLGWSLFLKLSQFLQHKCPNISRLVLTEPSIMTDPSALAYLPVLFQTMPSRLVHVELSLSSLSSSLACHQSIGGGASVVKGLEREVVEALVEYHGEVLEVFVVEVHTPLSFSTKVVDDPVVPPLLGSYFAQLQTHTPLDNVYFGHGQQQQQQQQQQLQQQQQRQQGLSYYLDLHQQHQQQQQHGVGGQGPTVSTPTPPTTTSTTSTIPPRRARTTKLTSTSRRPLLAVLESCPSLRIADCRLPLPLQEVIASFPNWACHSGLQVLRLELEELSGGGVCGVEGTAGRAMDADEEAVMEMFVKSLFIGSRASSMDVEAVEEEEEVPEKEEEMAMEMEEESSWRLTSEVGESSSWSSASVNGLDATAGDVSSGSSFPPSPASFSTTTSGITSSSSGDSMTTALPVHHTVTGPALLDETGFASRSQSPSSSLSSWTTGSGSSGNQLPSTLSTTESSSSSSGVSVTSVLDSGQIRQEQQRRVLGQSFATSLPLTLPSTLSVSTESSSTGSASSLMQSKITDPVRGSYFPPPPHPTIATTTPSSSISSHFNSSTRKINSSTQSSSTGSSTSSSNASTPGDTRSRQAVSAFLSSCSNYQVDAVGRLMALQFLVEHQLVRVPRLECFYLGEKVFRVPLREEGV